jgi:hypothetical protein
MATGTPSPSVSCSSSRGECQLAGGRVERAGGADDDLPEDAPVQSGGVHGGVHGLAHPVDRAGGLAARGGQAVFCDHAAGDVRDGDPDA